MKYIVGIDFGHGETTAHIFDLQAAGLNTRAGITAWLNGGQNNLANNIQGLSIKNGITKVRSVMCAEQNIVNGPWTYTLGPDVQKFYTLTRLSAINRRQSPDSAPEAPRFFAYFKHKIAKYGHLHFNSEDERAAYLYEEEAFGIFLKEVYRSVLNINDERSLTPLIEARGHNEANFILYTACPSGWNEVNRQDYCRFMNELGIPCKKVLREADAAWMTVMPQNIAGMQRPKILVIDYGSSTIDFTWSEDSCPDEQKTNHLGASRVEEDIFKYIKNNSEKSREALQITLDRVGDTLDNRIMLESLITYDIRDAKESFYSDLSHNPNPDTVCFRPIQLNSIVYGGTGEFSLDLDDNNGFINNTNLPTKIIADYISEVCNLMNNFKDRHMQDGGRYQQPRKIVLTGGASRMPFVAQLVQDVFGVTPMVDANEASERISKGIVLAGVKDYCLYGGYINHGDPARRSIIEELNRIRENIQDTNSLKDTLLRNVTEKMQASVRDNLKSLFERWKIGQILQGQAGGRSKDLDDFLLRTAQKKLADTEIANDIYGADTYYFRENTRLETWLLITKSIKDKTDFGEDHVSLDALFQSLRNNMRGFYSDEGISNSVYNDLPHIVGLEDLIDSLLHFVQIYFPNTSREDIRTLIHIPNPRINFRVIVQDDVRDSFLVNIVEKAFATVEEIDSQRSFLGFSDGISPWTLYKDRDERYRGDYFDSIRMDFDAFSRIIHPSSINNFDNVCNEISRVVCARIDEIIHYCTQLRAN